MADDISRTGAGYLTQPIRTYLDNLYAPPDATLALALSELERAGMPRIHIAPTEGKLLQLLLQLVSARKVVEIGTLSGYSALWILKALPRDGHLWTCEYDPRHAAVAREVFDKSGVASRVTVVEGPALNNLASLEPLGPFDAVFIDADKGNYDAYARWAFAHLRPGGLIIGDNAYLFGYLEGRAPDDQWGQAQIDGMRRFHEFLAEKCDALCLPTPDGMAIGIKGTV